MAVTAAGIALLLLLPLQQGPALRLLGWLLLLPVPCPPLQGWCFVAVC